MRLTIDLDPAEFEDLTQLVHSHGMRGERFRGILAKLIDARRRVDPSAHNSETTWLARAQSLVRGGVEFYGPRDAGNPVEGRYVVWGPLGEYRDSGQSLEHAAQLYLAQVCRDSMAITALKVRR